MARGPHPFAWLREHPFAADCLLSVALTAVTIPSIYVIGDESTRVHWSHPNLLAPLLVLAETIPLAWRRRRPDLVLFWVGGATVCYYAAGFRPGAAGLPAFVAFYSLAAHRAERSAIRPALVTLVALIASLTLYRGKVGIGTYAANGLLFAAAWIVGENMRNRRLAVAALHERAERLERDREANSRQAVARERSRIARELHDVVAHAMSVMVVQAGAARRVLSNEPAQAEEALRSIEDTGRQALGEMRRLVGVLRDEQDERAVNTADATARSPQPTVSELEGLIDGLREAGLEVTLDVEGEPVVLPSGVELSTFRVVQEALTNTLKHAGPARARVVLRWRPEDLEVEITDDGRGLAASLTSPASTGHGLVGMRERVGLYGGDLQAGPGAGGGFRVRARFPLVARPATPVGRS